MAINSSFKKKILRFIDSKLLRGFQREDNIPKIEIVDMALKNIFSKKVRTAITIGGMAIGIGTPTTTALGSAITTAGGARAGVTPASATTTSTDDTIRSANTYTFTAGADFAITEEGLFNGASAGTMVASRTFSAINVVSGDSLQITHDIVMSTT